MPSFSYYYFISVANVSNCNQERGKSYMLREVAGCRKLRKHLLLRVALEISSAAELQLVNVKGIFKQSRQMGPESTHIRRITVSIFREGRKVI